MIVVSHVCLCQCFHLHLWLLSYLFGYEFSCHSKWKKKQKRESGARANEWTRDRERRDFYGFNDVFINNFSTCWRRRATQIQLYTYWWCGIPFLTRLEAYGISLFVRFSLPISHTLSFYVSLSVLLLLLHYFPRTWRMHSLLPVLPWILSINCVN